MDNILYDLYPLITALIAMLLAQIIKTIYFYSKHNDLHWKGFFSSGGMPSAHSAMVTALTTAIAFKDGFFSSIFSVAVVFSLITLYDAAGIRRAAGKQAEVLNRIIEDFFKGKGLNIPKLTELLGHTPLEILAGVLLGIGVAFLTYKIF